MRVERRPVFSHLLVWISILIPLWIKAQGTDFGFTSGQFSVTESGSATYQIPLQVPPGSGGIQPELALSYSSFGNDGILGVGWSLTGISNITREMATHDQDGFKGYGVIAEDNRFSMDGERLVLSVGSKYGEDFTHYRKEINDHSRTIYFNTFNELDFFEVKTKSGLTYEYGRTEDSRLGWELTGTYCFDPPCSEVVPAVSWWLDKINDTKGNTILYEYDKTDNVTGVSIGSIYPTKILYTSNQGAGLDPVNVVEFEYEPRPDPVFMEVLLVDIKIDQRLKRITIKSSGEVVKEYEFEYLQGERSYLSSVTEKGMNGATLNSTTFQWVGNAGIEVLNLPAKLIQSGFTDVAAIPSDWNQDGYSDILLYDKSTGTNLWMINNQQNDFDEEAGYALSNSSIQGGTGLFTCELNGDGYPDLFWYDLETGENRWFINQNYQDVPGFVEYANVVAAGTLKDGVIFPGDWDGDGRTDFSWIGPNSQEKWYRSEGTAFSPGFEQIPVGFQVLKIVDGSVTKDFSNSTLTPVFQDFNSDGITDVMLYEKSTGKNSVIAIDFSQGIFKVSQSQYFPDHIKDGELVFGDFSGNGRLDLFWFSRTTGENRILVDKSFEPKENIIAPELLAKPEVSVISINWTGDNWDDLIVYDKATGDNTWYENQGFSSLLPGIDLEFEASLLTIGAQGIRGGKGLVFGDWGGNGFSSPLWYDGLGNSNIYLGVNRNLNKITAITEGSGYRIVISYARLTNPFVYKKFTDGIYPSIDFIGALEVVSGYYVTNGVGGTNQFSYLYEGAKFNLRGRGFRGFSKISITDHTTGVINEANYDRSGSQSFGFDLLSEKQFIGSTLLKETIYQREFLKLSHFAETNHYSYNANVREKKTTHYDTDGSFLKEISERYEYDDHGNTTIMVKDYGEGHVDSVVSTYTNATQNWILGRLTKLEYFRKSPGGSFTRRTSEFEYDIAGLLTKEIIEPENNQLRLSTSYTYDHFGNRVTMAREGFDGGSNSVRTTTWSYDLSGRFVLEEVNPLGHVVKREYDMIWGNVISIEGPNNLVTTWEYDDFGRKIGETRADGTTATRSFGWCDTDCPENAVYKIENRSTASPTDITYFDLLDREVRSAKVAFDNTWIFIDKEYDQKGNLVRESEPYFDGEPINWNDYQYDNISRLVRVTQPGDRTINYSYNGLSLTITNPLGQVFSREVNALGRTINTQDDAGSILAFEYDNFGNPIRITDPDGNKIVNTYDILGNLIENVDPDIGLTVYVTNAFGIHTQVTDQKGNVIDYLHDDLDRLVERKTAEGTTTWTYDGGVGGIGKIAGVVSTDAEEVFEYDELGRLTTHRKVIDGAEYVIRRSYDENSRPSKIVYPTGFNTRNVYTENGYLTEIQDGNTNESLWKLVATNARGQITEQQYGNGVVTTSTYDEVTGYLTGINSSLDFTDIQRLHYSHDALGNILSREDLLTDQQEIFTYDRLNRLLKSDLGNGQVQEIQYDKLGNITFKSDIGAYEYASTKPHAVTLISNEEPNPTLQGLLDLELVYTSFNKVKRIKNDTSEVNLTYGAANERILTQVFLHGSPLQTRHHVANLFERVFENGESVDVHFLRGPSGVFATYTSPTGGTGDLEYWHKDHINSLSVVTNDEGKVIREYSYDAWGRRRDPGDWSRYLFDLSAPNSSRGYGAHEHYDLQSLVNMNGRIYNPMLARFTSPDPFIQDIENLQDYNRYSYVKNNPLTLIDPSGYFSLNPFKFIKKVFKEIDRGLHRAAREMGRFYEKNKEIIIVVAAIGVGIATMGVGTGIVAALGGGAIASSIGAAAAFGFGFAASSTLFSGGSVGDALKAGTKTALISGLLVGGSIGLASVLPGSPMLGKILANGVVQGLYRDYSGGEFGIGFLSGAFSASVQVGKGMIEDPNTRLFATAIAGGTLSSINGGKFSNGVISSSAQAIFLDWSNSRNQSRQEGSREVRRRSQATRGPASEAGKFVRKIYGYFTTTDTEQAPNVLTEERIEVDGSTPEGAFTGAMYKWVQVFNNWASEHHMKFLLIPQTSKVENIAREGYYEGDEY